MRRAAAALVALSLAAPAPALTAPGAAQPALPRVRYVLCGVFVGVTFSEPAEVRRGHQAAAAQRWPAAAAAFVQAARAYQAMTSATEAELLVHNRFILYTNAALVWLNHGSTDAARTVLLDAAKRDPGLAAQLVEEADRLPAPPRCGRWTQRTP